MTDESPGESNAPLRDYLAVQRTMLANERTMLAYARTAIMLVASGSTLLKLYGDQPTSLIAGCVLLAAGIGVAALGGKRFKDRARLLK